jgi:P pilus assembly chaperone PapD
MQMMIVRASLLLVVLALVLTVRANAQMAPSQTAIQIDNVVNQWAQQLENDQKIIADLQKQLSDAKKANGGADKAK